MSYTELSDSEMIILAAECVGRGVPIPHEIAAHLGREIISDIQNPGGHHDGDNPTGARCDQ